MSLLDRLRGRREPEQPVHDLRRLPARASLDKIWERMLDSGNVSSSGVSITKEKALKVAVAWRCVNIRCTVLSSMPCDLMQRVDERTRKPAVSNPFRNVLTVKPNRWQTPSEFKRLMHARVMLKGNAYAYKRRLGREIRELIPLDPDSMEVSQNDDLSLSYAYTGRNGHRVPLTQDDILHLRGLSLDGITGLSVIRQAAESLGVSIQAEKTGAKLLKNGHFRSGFYKHPQRLSDEAYARLKADLSEKSGADADETGSAALLEEGMDWQAASMNAEEMEFIALRSFTRTDVGMWFEVPPFLYGDTEKSTSWGTGLEQQNIGFLQYTVQKDITIWEDALKRDCLADNPDLYAHFDTNGFFRLDAATRREYFKAALGSGGSPAWMTPNEVREKEDMPPRPEKWADELPKQQQPQASKGTQNEPQNPPGN